MAVGQGRNALGLVLVGGDIVHNITGEGIDFDFRENNLFAHRDVHVAEAIHQIVGIKGLACLGVQFPQDGFRRVEGLEVKVKGEGGGGHVVDSS